MTSILFANGRLPYFFSRWKMTLIFGQVEDDLNFLVNGRRPNNFFVTGGQTQFFFWMQDSLDYLWMEDNFKYCKDNVNFQNIKQD